MDARGLSYVIAVAENGSFTAAADARGIAQPSLSRAIATVERELGEPLFVRGRDGAALTEAGTALLPYAYAATAAIDRARAVFADRAGLLTGTLRVGVVAGLVDTVFPAAVAAFTRRYPGVRVRLVGRPGRELITRVQRGELDAAVLGLAETAPVPAGLAALTLREETVLAVARHGILPPGERAHVADLGSLPLVTYSTGSELGRVVHARLGGLMQGALCLADDPSLHIALAEAGAGVAVTAGSHAARAQAPALDVRPLEPGIAFGKRLVWRDDAPAGPALAALRRLVDAALRGELPDEG